MILGTVDRHHPRTVLEVGCGDSPWLPYLAKWRQVSVAGLDYSEQGCELARNRLQIENIRGSVYCADLFSADPGEIGQYDLVYSLGVVEHFTDLGNVIGHLLKFVNPGGVLLTEIPNLVSIHGFLSWVYQPAQLAKHKLIRKNELEDAYRSHSLVNISTAYVGTFSLGIVAWGLNQRFPKADMFLLLPVRILRKLNDLTMLRLNAYRGCSFLSPFLCASGVKPLG